MAPKNNSVAVQKEEAHGRHMEEDREDWASSYIQERRAQVEKTLRNLDIKAAWMTAEEKRERLYLRDQIETRIQMDAVQHQKQMEKERLKQQQEQRKKAIEKKYENANTLPVLQEIRRQKLEKMIKEITLKQEEARQRRWEKEMKLRAKFNKLTEKEQMKDLKRREKWQKKEDEIKEKEEKERQQMTMKNAEKQQKMEMRRAKAVKKMVEEEIKNEDERLKQEEKRRKKEEREKQKKEEEEKKQEMKKSIKEAKKLRKLCEKERKKHLDKERRENNTKEEHPEDFQDDKERKLEGLTHNTGRFVAWDVTSEISSDAATQQQSVRLKGALFPRMDRATVLVSTEQDDLVLEDVEDVPIDVEVLLIRGVLI